MIKFIFLFLTFSLYNSQNQRFYYEYNSNNSINFDNKQKDILTLDVSSNGSIFYSDKINQLDSLYATGKTTPIFPYKDVLFKEVITNIKDENPKLYYNGGRTKDYYEVILDNEMKWEVFPETKTYQSYTIQKAVTKIYNRTWEVWFTKDIPLNYGPYIFSGLPGLIISAEDKSRSHSFKLTGIKKLDNVELYTLPMFQSNYNRSGNKINLTLREFKKLLINLESDFLNNILSPPPAGTEVTTSKSYDSNGIEISEREFIENQKKMRKDILKRNDNKLINDFKL